MTLPLGILSLPIWQGVDDNGDVLPACLLYGYETGGSFSTPKHFFSAAQGGVALAHPVVADAGGRFVGLFLQNGGYDVRLKDANGVTVWSVRDVEDIAGTFLTYLGQEFATGSTAVTSGYTVLASDNYVETAAVATSPFIINLQDAAARTFPLCIKHKGSAQLRITPNGAQTIEGLAAYYAVAAASSPNFPTVWLWPLADGSGYVIGASHGL